MTTPPRLPPYIPPRQTLSRQTLSRPSAPAINRASASPRELSLALPGFDEVLPIVYGEDRIAGLWLVRPYVASSQLRFAIAWCWGEIEGVQAVYINGAAVPGGVTMTHYAGTATQTPNSLLATDIAGFNDAYANIAYTVFQVPAGTITGFPNTAQIEAVVRGRIVRDPRIPSADPASARYWRILITETRTTSGTLFASIAEIEMRATVGGADQTGSGTAYASSQTVNTAAMAFDNNPATRWASGASEAPPQWIAYDFGASITVAEIAIRAPDSTDPAARAPRSFVVQYSSNNTDWDDAATFTNEPAWDVGEIRSYRTVPGMAWTKNPALCMADFIQSEAFGPAMSVTGVVAAADRCDEIVAGAEVRCEMGLTIKNPLPLDQMLDLFSAYAECLWSYDGDGILMVPDAPVMAPDAMLTEDDIIAGTLRLTVEDSSSAPTVVSITYRAHGATDAAQWEEQVHIQMLPEVSAGDVPAVRSDLQMLGLRRQSEAARKAIMRLRRLNYPGRYAWQAFDDGIKFQRGDVVQLPNMRGMTDRMVRILSTEMPAPGIYQVTAEQYDANMYSDDFVPGDTAQVPVGGILPYTGSVAPDGYELFAEANGRYIIGSGGGYTHGSTGGASTVAGWSGRTGMDGLHSGLREMRVYGARGPNPGFDIPHSGVTPPYTGDHDHPLTVAESNVLNPRARKSVWVKKVSAPGPIPQGAEVLCDGELISSTLSAVSSHLGRIIMADSASGDFGSGSASAVATIGSTSGAHGHASEYYERVLSGPLSGAFEYTFEYEQGGYPHDHGGSATVTYSANPRRKKMAAYMATSDAPIQAGCVIGFDPSETLPPGWSVCDGTNGTVDLRGFFIERSSANGAGASAGNNTASFSRATPQDMDHDHVGDSRGYYQPFTMWWHGNEEMHDHQISGSRPFIPPYYAMTFIQYTGVE